ncbi:uncharacterized protein LOC128680468 [Plodia interpunctella]|uniref:uncharacterized protein LOC128680468 n=1 Tax=Plodia interpunctella TaxID=58824 RepID=UPI00236849F1|nr:uncharacterized protein LOC128680468 [Plodia interpunctella]
MTTPVQPAPVTGRVKNPCRICDLSVADKGGVQCKGACGRWAHYKCLGFTPQMILDARDGKFEIICPCPHCNLKKLDEELHKEWQCIQVDGSCPKERIDKPRVLKPSACVAEIQECNKATCDPPCSAAITKKSVTPRPATAVKPTVATKPPTPTKSAATPTTVVARAGNDSTTASVKSTAVSPAGSPHSLPVADNPNSGSSGPVSPVSKSPVSDSPVPNIPVAKTPIKKVAVPKVAISDSPKSGSPVPKKPVPQVPHKIEAQTSYTFPCTAKGGIVPCGQSPPCAGPTPCGPNYPCAIIEAEKHKKVLYKHVKHRFKNPYECIPPILDKTPSDMSLTNQNLICDSDVCRDLDCGPDAMCNTDAFTYEGNRLLKCVRDPICTKNPKPVPMAGNPHTRNTIPKERKFEKSPKPADINLGSQQAPCRNCKCCTASGPMLDQFKCVSTWCPTKYPRTLKSATTCTEDKSKSCTCMKVNRLATDIITTTELANTHSRLIPSVSDSMVLKTGQSTLMCAIDQLCATVGQLTGQIQMLLVRKPK